jgi:hypothetical protein
MKVTYPIYVLERDDFSFREFTCSEDLLFCEREDVLEGLYDGWDSCGRHIAIHWDDGRDIPTALVDQENSVGAFTEAVERYAERYDPQSLGFGARKKTANEALCDALYLRVRLGQIRQR